MTVDLSTPAPKPPGIIKKLSRNETLTKGAWKRMNDFPAALRQLSAQLKLLKGGSCAVGNFVT